MKTLRSFVTFLKTFQYMWNRPSIDSKIWGRLTATFGPDILRVFDAKLGCVQMRSKAGYQLVCIVQRRHKASERKLGTAIQWNASEHVGHDKYYRLLIQQCTFTAVEYRSCYNENCFKADVCCQPCGWVVLQIFGLVEWATLTLIDMQATCKNNMSSELYQS